jgi:hypothetical protein
MIPRKNILHLQNAIFAQAAERSHATDFVKLAKTHFARVIKTKKIIIIVWNTGCNFVEFLEPVYLLYV